MTHVSWSEVGSSGASKVEMGLVIDCVQPWDSWGLKTHKYLRDIGRSFRDIP